MDEQARAHHHAVAHGEYEFRHIDMSERSGWDEEHMDQNDYAKPADDVFARRFKNPKVKELKKNSTKIPKNQNMNPIQ